MRRRAGTQLGVSLVEALVALAVLSFGMLAVVGVQATLRLNSDVAKQRSEAVRIAQEAIEGWRSYSQLATDAAGVRLAYADVTGAGPQTVAGYTTNTTYTLERTVIDQAAQNHKSLRVTVRWADRSGNAQGITLDSLLARIDPALTASVLPAGPAGLPAARPLGRHAGIPRGAKDLGGLHSVFKPPVAGGGADGSGGTLAWVFNNVSGMITGVCTVAAGTTTSSLSATDIAACRDNTLAHLLSGFVRFATTSAQPSAADAESPASLARNLDISLTVTDGRLASCFDDAPTTSVQAALQTVVTYYCAIPANANRTWEGYSTILPLPFADLANSAWAIPARTLPPGVSPDHQLCRYTPAADDNQLVPNAQHPYRYRIEYADPARQRQPLPMPPLVNQNFLVILIQNSCPTDVPADPAHGDFVSSNTLVHRPLP